MHAARRSLLVTTGKSSSLYNNQTEDIITVGIERNSEGVRLVPDVANCPSGMPALAVHGFKH